jgi:septal ring factor EnvC (AmiA/AmiB activator)
MKELHNKIQELAKEASELSNVRAGLHKQLKEIETRLTQISGALVELQKLQKEIGDNNGDQASNSGEPKVSGSAGQAQ